MKKIKFSDFSEYQLGIFWGIASYTDNRITFRSKHKYYLDVLNNVINRNIYIQYPKEKEQYVLKTSCIDIETFKMNNWTDRNSNIRYIPKLKSYNNFLRGYIELHSTLDYSTRYTNNKKNKYKALRLRIYGNYKLIDNINDIISSQVDLVSLKKPQQIHNETTRVLYYSSPNEINKIYEYIYGEERNVDYWNNVQSLLKIPTKGY